MRRLKALCVSSVACGYALVGVACWDFSFAPLEETPDTPDATQPDRGVDAKEAAPLEERVDAPVVTMCRAGGLYCGGGLIPGDSFTLYECAADGGGAISVKCANGCFRTSGDPGTDRCQAPTPCIVGGFYCGGDKVNGHPDSLFRCDANKEGQFVQVCEKGCAVGDAGQDDGCR